MSYLYNVYRHPKKGQWGFTGAIDGEIRTAFVDGRDQQVTTDLITTIKFAPRLAKLLRSGYTRVSQPHYLLQTTRDGLKTGSFVLRHPELGEDLRGDLVLFAALPPQLAMADVVNEWDSALSDADSPDEQARSAWLEHCAATATYVPAMSHDPHGVLLVAQWARENSLVLIAAKGSLPVASPKDARYAWREFLQHWFEPRSIDTALTQLGWPLRDALSAPVATEQTTLPGGEDRWLDLTQQAAF